mgnify:CR=1 FL=1
MKIKCSTFLHLLKNKNIEQIFDFLDFNILDIIDIVLVAMLLFYAYRLVKGTAAINIFVGIVILYLIWKITDALKMELLSNILGGFMRVGVFALIVVFQQEIRMVPYCALHS